MNKNIRFTVSIFAVFILITLSTAPVFAAKVVSPEIQGAYLLYDTDRIVIEGTNLSDGVPINSETFEDLAVWLGDMRLDVLFIDEASITANVNYDSIPAPGEYQLMVINAVPRTNPATLMVTIGAFGPEGEIGPQGLEGPTGPTGPAGPQGAPGGDGSSCSVAQETGGATISCEDGSTATISDGADGVSKADLDEAASTILDAVAESSAKIDAIYNAFNKTVGGVCRDTVFVGIRPDGTIGEMIGAADCNGDCYRDNDLDLYGDPQNSLSACIGLPEGYVWDNTDCDDTDASINPGAAEISNDDIDQDCSGADYIPRFTDNGDGTRTDILTGLTWAYTSYTGTWENAKTFAAVLNSGEYGLTDGSVEGDWRLPTLEELQERGTIPATSWGSGIWPEGVYWSSNTDDIGDPPTTTIIGFSEWTSTELNDAGDNVWTVNVDAGGFVPVDKVCDWWWGCPEPARYVGRPVRN